LGSWRPAAQRLAVPSGGPAVWADVFKQEALA